LPITSAKMIAPSRDIYWPRQNLGMMIGGKDNANHTTATHIIAAIRAITTNTRSPFDMGRNSEVTS